MVDELIVCPSCKSDKFKLVVDNLTGSLSVVCSDCNLSCTFGGGLTVRTLILYIKHNGKVF